jgi:hypothetical protein
MAAEAALRRPLLALGEVEDRQQVARHAGGQLDTGMGLDDDHVIGDDDHVGGGLAGRHRHEVTRAAGRVD